MTKGWVLSIILPLVMFSSMTQVALAIGAINVPIEINQFSKGWSVSNVRCS